MGSAMQSTGAIELHTTTTPRVPLPELSYIENYNTMTPLATTASRSLSPAPCAQQPHEQDSTDKSSAVP